MTDERKPAARKRRKPDAESASQRNRRRIFAALAALSLSSLAYSLLIITDIEGSLGPVLTAVGLAAVAFLVLLGVLRQEHSGDGALQIALQLLPRLSEYAARRRRTFWIVSLSLVAVALSAVWLGPHRVREITVACGDARSVEIDGEERPCDVTYAAQVWRWPLRESPLPALTCVAARIERWPTEFDPDGKAECGSRPQSAQFVTNGIADPPLDHRRFAEARAARRLADLRRALRRSIPGRRFDDVLLVATWQLSGLGRSRQSEVRLSEAHLYIAEIISYFDIVALQEVKSTRDLERILRLLGPNYDAVVSAVSPGPAGNGEHSAFIYDRRKVSRRPFASSLVVPGDHKRAWLDRTASVREDRYRIMEQPSRAPFLAQFETGGRAFRMLTAHLYFGSDSDPEARERRLAEIRDIFSYVARLPAGGGPDEIGVAPPPISTDDESDHPLIFAGNLQAMAADGPEIAAVLEAGFAIDPASRALASNFRMTRPFDQIAILQGRRGRLAFSRSGVFNFFNHVFRDADAPLYRAEMAGDRGGDFRRWSLLQMSDHLPKWAEIRIMGEAR